MPKVAIIAAMEREVATLVAGWRAFRDPVAAYRCFAKGDVVVICSGIGIGAASASAEMAQARYSPDLMISAGIAGALVSELKVGSIFLPGQVFDSKTGVRFNTASAGEGVLLTVPDAIGATEKRELSQRHAAQAVDMEASAVALVAQSHGIPFLAVKAISDEVNFALPEMGPYIASDGRFQSARFALHAAVHPTSWGVVRQLAVNSRRASQELCAFLRHRINENSWIDSVEPEMGQKADHGERAVHDRAQ